MQFARDEDGNNGSGDERRAMLNGFEGLDEVSLGEVFEVRAQVMKTVPNFMKGVFRRGLKMSLEEILNCRAQSDTVKEWKFPGCCFSDHHGTGAQGKVAREVTPSDWLTLLETSLKASVTRTTTRCRRRRGHHPRGRLEHWVLCTWESCQTPARGLKGILWHQEQRRRGRR